MTMKTFKILPVPVVLLSLGLASLGSRAEAANANTFQLQMRSTMSGASTGTGPQGWANSRYTQTGLTTNQTLQISCRGLAPNQVYHLMASVGTNGQWVHLSDFTPNQSGAIMVQYLAGMPHHFVGTNDPGQAWAMMGGWTHHMSWVLSPGSGTNWCDGIDGQSEGPQSLAMGNSGSNSGMGGSGPMTGPGGQGTTGPTAVSAEWEVFRGWVAWAGWMIWMKWWTVGPP